MKLLSELELYHIYRTCGSIVSFDFVYTGRYWSDGEYGYKCMILDVIFIPKSLGDYSYGDICRWHFGKDSRRFKYLGYNAEEARMAKLLSL
jgi:hypothetical protein